MPQTNFDTPVDFLSQIGLKYAPSIPYDSRAYFNREGFYNITDENLQNRVLDIRREILRANHSNFYSEDFIEEMKERGLQRHLESLGPIFRFCGFDLRNFSSRVDRPLKVLQLGSGPIEYSKSARYYNGPILDEKLREYGAEVTNLDFLDSAAHYPYSEFIQGNWFDLESLICDREFDVMFTSHMHPLVGNKGVLTLKRRTELLETTLNSLKRNNQDGPKLFYVSGESVDDFHFEDFDEPLREIATDIEGFEYLSLLSNKGHRTNLFVANQ